MPEHDRILIVDDQIINLKTLTSTLKKDYKIIIATSGQQALDIVFSENPPDLILLDIMMPDMNGYEVLNRLKKNEKARNIPILFVTSMQDDTDEAYGLELGAVDYIKKPFSLPVVKSRIKTHLELKKSHEKINKQFELLQKYVDDDTLNFMMRNDSKINELFMSEIINGTVCFIDICDFTKISEKYSPKTVASMLNRYFDLFVKEILCRKGHIDKFLGDAIMAFFKDDNHINRALETCIAIKNNVTELIENEKDSDFKYPHVSIGINSGDMIYGNFGSETLNRLDLTVIGDVVNTAFRLQSVADKGEIAVEEKLNKKIKDFALTKEIGQMELKNKKNPVRVYTVKKIK